MDVILICSLAVVSAVVSKLLESDKEMKFLLTLSAVIIIGTQCVASLSGATDAIEEFLKEIELSDEYVRIMLKALGICIVSKLCSDCCKDCGENALASQVELVCRVALVVVSLPLYKTVMKIALSLIDN